MSTPENENHPIAFLDVMTCGFGSLLFLFFIFIAIKENLDFRACKPKLNRRPAPLIIVVSGAENDKPCFSSHKNSSWKLPENYRCHTNSSPYLSALYAPTAPDSGQEIHLIGINGRAPIYLQWFWGRKVIRRRLIPRDIGAAYHKNTIRLWPIPESLARKVLE